MELSKKIILFSAAAIVAAGIAGGMIYVGGQRVEDAIVTQLDAHKGHNFDGFVLDWAERTPLQDGRTTLRGITGRYNGEVVLNIDSADIVRSGLSLQVVGHNITTQMNGTTEKAETVTIDGLEQAGLNTLLSTPPNTTAQALALMNGVRLTTDRLEVQSTPPTTIRRTEASFADGKISRFVISDLASSDNRNNNVTIGSAVLQNLPVERLAALRDTRPETAEQFMALMDGVSIEADQVHAQNSSYGTFTLTRAQSRFAGQHLHDVQITALSLEQTNKPLESGHVASISIDRFNVVKFMAVMGNAIGVSGHGNNAIIGVGGHENYDISRAEILDVNISGIFRFRSLTLVRQGNISEGRMNDAVLDLSAFPDVSVRSADIPPVVVPELVSRERFDENTYSVDFTIPMRDIADWQGYYSFDNLGFTGNGAHLPDAARPGALTVNTRIQDHGLIDLIVNRADEERDVLATRASIGAAAMLLRFRIADTAGLPERLSAFIRNGTPLEFGISVIVSPDNVRGMPQIRITEPGRLSLD